MVNARTRCGDVPTALFAGPGGVPRGRSTTVSRGPTAPEILLAGRDSNPNFQGQNLASCH